jgi:hypothetical protein
MFNLRASIQALGRLVPAQFKRRGDLRRQRRALLRESPASQRDEHRQHEAKPTKE